MRHVLQPFDYQGAPLGYHFKTTVHITPIFKTKELVLTILDEEQHYVSTTNMTHPHLRHIYLHHTATGLEHRA